MDERDDGEQHVLFQRAHAALQASVRPEAVFATLAGDTHDLRAAALAVCAALGVPRQQAQQRWAKTGEALLSQMRPGDEARDFGDVLEYAGFFDVHPDLNERDQHARRLLERAFNAAGGIPSGYAHGMIRKLQTGRLADAFVSMATHGARRSRPTPPDYWRDLLAAAELLSSTENDQFEPCVALCRRQLEQTGP
jgi:hypothetical protein